MSYKIHNEPPGVGTAAKTLKSVIYYNVYNVPAWRHQTTKTGCKQFAARQPANG